MHHLRKQSSQGIAKLMGYHFHPTPMTTPRCPLSAARSRALTGIQTVD
jgi:hypothetical protein